MVTKRVAHLEQAVERDTKNRNKRKRVPKIRQMESVGRATVKGKKKKKDWKKIRGHVWPERSKHGSETKKGRERRQKAEKKGEKR